MIILPDDPKERTKAIVALSRGQSFEFWIGNKKYTTRPKISSEHYPAVRWLRIKYALIGWWRGYPRCHCGRIAVERSAGDVRQYVCLRGRCSFCAYERTPIR